MRLDVAVVAVTGGASGIGAECIQIFASAGSKVAIWDLNEELGSQFAQRLGPNAIFCKCDVTSPESVESAVEATVAKFGQINVLVNSAGVAWAELTLTNKGVHKQETFERVLQINLFGTFNVSRLVSKQMIKQEGIGVNQERGVIINLASVAGIEGQRGQLAYSASKGGVLGMTLPMARDLAAFKIRVATIAPGLIKTPMASGVNDKVAEVLMKSTPLGRLGEPSEVAQLAKSIAENEFITGTYIRLDGGIRFPHL